MKLRYLTYVALFLLLKTVAFANDCTQTVDNRFNVQKQDIEDRKVRMSLECDSSHQRTYEYCSTLSGYGTYNVGPVKYNDVQRCKSRADEDRLNCYQRVADRYNSDMARLIDQRTQDLRNCR